jgi:FkbM family methyltransferase
VNNWKYLKKGSFTIKTAQKIKIAQIVCSVVLSLRKIRGLKNQTIVKRGGIWWDLDLTEGIDFSIYLLGGFEPRTLKLYKKIVNKGDIILDIGANIGSHTLPLALNTGKNGKVFAIEPTQYAVTKLRKNLNLNEDLSSNISVCQLMLVADENEHLESGIYSSWPLFHDGKRIHPEHKGQLMGTEGAVALTLDKMVKQMHINTIDFIKLDVDGHEYSVLMGGKETLKASAPIILMEFAPYLFDAEGFEKILVFLKELDYSLFDANTGNKLPLNQEYLRKIIPTGGSRNILLKPNQKNENMRL